MQIGGFGSCYPRFSQMHINTPGGGGGVEGGTWVFRGVHTFVIKIKNTPKALISGQKS